MLRFRLLVVSALLFTAACATEQDRQAKAAAEHTCHQQFPNDAHQYQVCVTEVENSIRDAREYRAPPPAPPPPPRRPSH